MFLVDSHCHLNLLNLTPEMGGIDTVIARAQENSVHYLLNVCVALSEFAKVLGTAEAYTNVGASVGLHPNDQEEEADTDTLIALAKHPKVIAIGETGLDYFRTTGDVGWQQERFRRHIQAAIQAKKPLIIHTRAAKEDTIRIMREEQAEQIGGVMHCFSEDLTTAMQAMELGFYISFSGVVTFKNALTTQEVARHVPLDRMLIETDAPYLAPVPKRGQPNEPSYVRYTAEYLSQLHQVSLEAFAAQTTANFFELFKGAVRPHV